MFSYDFDRVLYSYHWVSDWVCVCVTRLYAHICKCLTDLSQPTTYSCSSSLLCKLVSWMFLRSSFGDGLEFLFVFAVMFFWTTFSSFSQRRGKMRGNFGTFFHTCVLSLYVCTNAHTHSLTNVHILLGFLLESFYTNTHTRAYFYVEIPEGCLEQFPISFWEYFSWIMLPRGNTFCFPTGKSLQYRRILQDM